MKIGILTFHYAHNYGATLQAFALKSYLTEMGHSVDMINYKNDTIAAEYKRKLGRKFPFKYLLHPNRFKIELSKCLDLKNAQSQWNVKYEKFEKFIKEYLSYSETTINKEEMGVLDYDAFIVGSDQVWNKYLTGGLDSVYFLDFQTNAKKIFYAVSNGSSKIEDRDVDYYKKILDGVSGVSTRENDLATEIKNVTGKDAVSVVDPSFLLKKVDYVRYFNLKKDNSEKYLFAYYLLENVEDKKMAEIVGVISRALHLKVVELHCYKTREMKEDYQRADMGPIEFLQNIYNAEFVVTNSFHGTVFSIIFQKQFYSFYNNDSRKNNLLKALNLTDRHIYNATAMDLNEKIDYSAIDLNVYAETSKSFLKNVLNEVKD